MSDKIVIRAQHVAKAYRDGNEAVPVLKDINLEIAEGETVAIVGASGSGKSTLLHVIGGLDSVDMGEVTVADMPVHTLNETERGHLRNEKLGFVYQFHHLLPEFTALENVAMPLFIRRMDRTQALAKAEALLTDLGLGHRLHHRPSQMSGGERQRCAIARAMVTDPACILADEPTGNLDQATAAAVFEKFMELARRSKTATVIVTHDTQLAAQCDRVITLVDGTIG